MRRLLYSIPTAALALLTAGCQTETAQIGVVLPLTGPDQAYGESSRRGLELALGELRAAGNTTLELRIEDSQGDPGRARQLLDQLYAANALAAIGGVTPREAEALAPLADERDRVLLSPSAGNQLLSEGSRHFYRLAPSDAAYGSTLATFASHRLSLETAAVVAEDGRWARSLEDGFQPTFESLGGQLVQVLEAPDAGELATAVGELERLAPQAVILAGYGGWLEAAIRQIKGSSYGGRVLTTQTIASRAFLESLGAEAEGVIVAHSALDPAGNEQARAFVDGYRSRFGSDPDIFAAEAYDTLKVLALALEDRPLIASEVRRGLRDEIKSYPGVTGSLEFDDTGSVSKFPRVYDITADLGLRDYGDYLEAKRQEIEEKKRQIRERMKELEQRAASTASAS